MGMILNNPSLLGLSAAEKIKGPDVPGRDAQQHHSERAYGQESPK
jgi:hypothetical protein